jgi:hypothetical protein
VTACFSAVLPAPVDADWAVARDLGDYRLFTSGRGEVLVEDGRSGDSVGAVRRACLDGRTVRQFARDDGVMRRGHGRSAPAATERISQSRNRAIFGVSAVSSGATT